MKAVKIIIVAVIVAALGFGIYKLTEKLFFPNVEPVIEVPDGCDLKSETNYVQMELGKIKDDDFKGLETRYVQLSELYKHELGDAPQCLAVVTMSLRSSYIERFVQMADKEFAKDRWSHNKVIGELNKRIKTEVSEENAKLLRIENILKEFNKVLYFNSSVNTQCRQLPKSIKDKWNISNARNIIYEKRPSVNEPVRHTAQYLDTDINVVKQKLYNGHVAFLESLVELLGTTINDRVVMEEWENNDREAVAKEIERFTNNAAELYGRSTSDVNSVEKRLNVKLELYTNEVERIERERMAVEDSLMRINQMILENDDKD